MMIQRNGSLAITLGSAKDTERLGGTENWTTSRSEILLGFLRLISETEGNWSPRNQEAPDWFYLGFQLQWGPLKISEFLFPLE